MGMEKFDKEIFNYAYKFIPYISILFDDEVCFGITDKEKYILSYNKNKRYWWNYKYY